MHVYPLHRDCHDTFVINAVAWQVSASWGYNRKTKAMKKMRAVKQKKHDETSSYHQPLI